MLEIIDFILVVSLGLITIISGVICVIYRKKLRAYKYQGGTVNLYIAEEYIDYKNEEDRKYLVFRKNLEIYKIASSMPIIIFIIQFAYLIDATIGVLLICIGIYKLNAIKTYILAKSSSYIF